MESRIVKTILSNDELHFEEDTTEKQRKELLEKGEIYTTDAFEEIKKEIDFKTLKNIFSELLHRTDIDHTSFNFLQSEEIYLSDTIDSIGLYKMHSNIIIVNSAITYFGKLENVLETIIHEQTHAVGRNICIEKATIKNDSISNLRLKVISGYYRGEENRDVLNSDKNEQNISFNLFNEGVTQLITDDVYEEYNKRTGLHLKNSSLSYSKEKKIVKKFIKIISIRLGVEYEIIWNAMKKGYLEGLNFQEESIKNELDFILFWINLEDLAEMTNKTTDRLYNELNAIYLTFCDDERREKGSATKFGF